MKNRVIYFAVVAALFTIGCTQQKSITGRIISLEEALGNIEEIKLSKYASKIEYVLLDNSDSIMLPGVKDLQIKGAGDIFLSVMLSSH